jgi:excisionase family DNA binding protein
LLCVASIHATTPLSPARRLADAARQLRASRAPLAVDALDIGDIVLPASVLDAAATVLREQSRGRDPQIAVLPERLSAQQAADLIGVSRPHLAMLLDRERIPYETTPGGHRRILRADVEAHLQRQKLAQVAMHDAMRSAESLADDDR